MKASQFARLLAPLTNRIRMMIARAVISTVNDDTKVQQMCIKLLAGEMKDKVDRLQEYGFTSVPHSGMEAAVVFINGDRGNPMIVAVGDRKYRLKGLKNGEVAIYTDEGDHIHLKRNNTIVVKTLHLEVNAAEDVSYNTKTMTINASDSFELTTAQATVSASGAINTTAPTFMQTGALVATAGLTWGGTAQGMNGTTAKVDGDIEITGKSTAQDHISSGKSGAAHTHTSQSGGGQTSGPQ